MLRYTANVWIPRALGTAFPYHTLIVNIVGSLVMGLLAGYFALKSDPGQDWRLFLTTGIMGGFTTFSAFSLDTVVLYQRGEVALLGELRLHQHAGAGAVRQLRGIAGGEEAAFLDALAILEHRL